MDFVKKHIIARMTQAEIDAALMAKMEADEKEIERLRDLLFARGAMNEPPCFCCGYNGPGYFQPTTHPCAELHHRLMPNA